MPRKCRRQMRQKLISNSIAGRICSGFSQPSRPAGRKMTWTNIKTSSLSDAGRHKADLWDQSRQADMGRERHSDTGHSVNVMAQRSPSQSNAADTLARFQPAETRIRLAVETGGTRRRLRKAGFG